MSRSTLKRPGLALRCDHQAALAWCGPGRRFRSWPDELPRRPWGRAVACVPWAAQALLRVQHSRARPSECHPGIAPALDVAADLADDTVMLSILLLQTRDRRSSGGNPRRVHGEGLVEALQDGAGDARCLLLQAPGEIAQKAFGLPGIVEFPGLSQPISGKSFSVLHRTRSRGETRSRVRCHARNPLRHPDFLRRTGHEPAVHPHVRYPETRHSRSPFHSTEGTRNL